MNLRSGVNPMSPEKAVRVVQADLENPSHQAATLEMIDSYSRDPYGDGRPLGEDVLQRLVPGLRAHPTTLIFLAFLLDEIAGAAICFRGFSTFAARPLLNIHDLIVAPRFRGRGVGKALLLEAERSARQIECCKLTLEVLDKNTVALNAYRSAGFTQYTLQEHAGKAIVMSKSL
jgi:ribosomal protein S18 acetylase RimI-like enzyme